VRLVRNPRIPVVVHLIQEEAEQTQAYPYEKTVSLKLEGTVEALVDRLSEQVDGMAVRRMLFTGERRDLTTRIAIDTSRAQVRSVITDCLPLARYSRLLWEGTTVFSNDKPHFLVLHCGTDAPDLPSRTKTSGEVIPFAQGRPAFYSNPADAEVRRAALDFIAAQMKQEKPHQVRWAMRYLGYHRMPEGIAPLVQHITYRYTTAPRLDEARV
jgi:hypothetical protein